jgi:hypothetical protein
MVTVEGKGKGGEEKKGGSITPQFAAPFSIPTDLSQKMLDTLPLWLRLAVILVSFSLIVVLGSLFVLLCFLLLSF